MGPAESDKNAECHVSSDKRASWTRWWSAGNNTDSNTSNASTFGCPHMAAASSVEEAAMHAQIPQFPDQNTPLSTDRVVSSIPRGSNDAPHHQTTQETSKWVYPSEQQFYNAMRRKGYDAPPEQTMPHIIQIHNAVNERTWYHVLRWEQTLHQSTPKLLRFMGKPDQRSPRAWLYSTLLGYQPPFDRHDWFIDRGDGSGERRYVIDFYDGHASKNSAAPINIYLDVRPAIDDLSSLKDRVEMAIREALPGIFDAGSPTSSQSVPNLSCVSSSSKKAK